MGITTVRLDSKKLLIRKTSLNWFKPVHGQLSDSTDPQRRHGHITLEFSFILCKNNFKDYLAKHAYIHIFQTIIIFRVGTEMDVIFVDFSREKTLS